MARNGSRGTLVMWVLSQTRREKDIFCRESRCFSVKTPGFSHQNLQRQKQGLSTQPRRRPLPPYCAEGEGRRWLGTRGGLG